MWSARRFGLQAAFFLPTSCEPSVMERMLCSPLVDFLAFPPASVSNSALEISMPNVRPIHTSASISRNQFLQVGFSGALGLGLADLATGRKANAAMESNALFGRAKSVVLLFLSGAPSHQDIWDLKPDAPAEVRGEFRPIDTVASGVQIGPHVPRLAMVAE